MKTIQLYPVILIYCIYIMHPQPVMAYSKFNFFDNKIIPKLILTEAKTALAHYPELENVSIEFRFKSSLKKSFMKAQPLLHTIFKKKEERKYVILMSRIFKVEEKEMHVEDIPKNVLTGWLGHELGHIMDYRNRSSMDLAWFGIKYSFSPRFIRKAERTADSYAIQYGMKDYILATKDFILNNSDLSEKYKARIKRLYVSPEEILKIVQENK